MTHDEMIAVISAHKAGKLIQSRSVFSNKEWTDVTAPSWSFSTMDYRVKPIEKVWVSMAYADGHIGPAWPMDMDKRDSYMKDKARMRTRFPISHFIVISDSKSVIWPVPGS